MIALIIIFVVFFALLAWRRLDLAAALIIAALPAYQIRFNLGFLPMTLLEAMILVLFALPAQAGIPSKYQTVPFSFGNYFIAYRCACFRRSRWVYQRELRNSESIFYRTGDVFYRFC